MLSTASGATRRTTLRIASKVYRRSSGPSERNSSTVSALDLMGISGSLDGLGELEDIPSEKPSWRQPPLALPLRLCSLFAALLGSGVVGGQRFLEAGQYFLESGMQPDGVKAGIGP